ncbi:formin-D-like [Onthophagus taurus]|uniref:formin-D-like n=1 Tax=Onthophagus taurus TaxID=166361 RepID=UPI0039BE9867
MTSAMDTEELKKFLQDAGMYEENMNEDEMLSYYNAIKCSENTAKEEDQCRQNESVELVENDSADQNTSGEMMKMDTNDDNSKEDVIENAILDPMNCKPSKVYKFHHKTRPLRYKLPPYHDPEYANLSVDDRANIISEFHLQQIKIFSEFHKKSKTFVSFGKDIPCNFINVNDVFMEDVGEPSEETYISRSGRHTRRKDYSECNASPKINQNKREKRDKNFNCSPTTLRTQQIQNLSNEQIMQRSRFFNDSPKSSTTLSKPPLNEKKQGEELVTDSLLKNSNTQEKKYNLNPAWLTQSDNSEEEVKEVDAEEFPVIRRRIPPPIRGRKGISKRTRSTLEMEASETVTSSLKPILQVSPSVSASNSQNLPPNSTNKKRRTKSTMMCPICSEYFKSDEVEAHASNCGLGMTNPVIFEIASNQTSKRMVRCNICDKEMVENTDYEIHVSDCLKRQQMK